MASDEVQPLTPAKKENTETSLDLDVIPTPDTHPSVFFTLLDLVVIAKGAKGVGTGWDRPQ